MQIISKSGIYFRAKEERLNDKKQVGILDDKDDSEILSWVGKSRKLDEKRQETEKALRLARALEEQVMS